MATQKYFNNKIRKLPGVYSMIRSAVNNPPLTSDYGKVLIIDTGNLGATYVGGTGVNGEAKQGLDSLYEFKSISEAKSLIRGGYLLKVIEGLFKPYQNQPGISSLYFIKAATTTQSDLSFTGTGGGGAGGTFAFHTLDEGVVANGVLDAGNDDNLIKGYAYTIEAGVVDTAKWIFKIWRGTYSGTAADTISYDEIAQVDSKPILICQSPEFNNIAELVAWADTDYDFNQFFIKGTCTVTGTGVINAADVTAVAGYNVSAAATETFDSDDLAAALDVVVDLDYTFILSDLYGSDDYDGASVGAIVSHIQTDAKYDKYLVYGGGADRTEWTATDGSIDIAAYFDTQQVIVVHGDALKASTKSPTGFRQWPTVVKSAYVLGRTAGLPPQVPVTFKAIAIDGEVHKLNEKDRELALDSGVLVTYFDTDFNNFVVQQGINTIQDNKNVLKADGASFSIQAERIKAQLNKDIVINAKIQLLGQPNGVNRNTLSAAYVKNWTETFLETKKATAAQDNLIIEYDNVVVTKEQDSWVVTYDFVLNGERTKLFFQGAVTDF